MIAPKYEFHVFAFVMSFIMSGMLSLAMTLFGASTLSHVVQLWPSAWAKSLVVAFPVSLFVVPWAKRLVASWVTRAPH